MKKFPLTSKDWRASETTNFSQSALYSFDPTFNPPLSYPMDRYVYYPLRTPIRLNLTLIMHWLYYVLGQKTFFILMNKLQLKAP